MYKIAIIGLLYSVVKQTKFILKSTGLVNRSFSFCGNRMTSPLYVNSILVGSRIPVFSSKLRGQFGVQRGQFEESIGLSCDSRPFVAKSLLCPDAIDILVTSVLAVESRSWYTST